MYKIEYKVGAKKSLEKFPYKDRERIIKEIESLAKNPRKYGVIKLTSIDPSEYRTRQGDYRIKFTIHDDILTVWIIRIFIRGDEY